MFIIEKHIWEKEENKTKITIHRSQGQTLSQASMILNRSVLEKGQGYVALSRLTSLDGLNLLEFNPTIFRIDNTVKAFYKKFPKNDNLVQHLSPT